MFVYEQKSIESFFQEHSIQDPDTKARLLPVLTPLIYTYNQHVIGYEKEADEYRKKQEQTSLEEISKQIEKAITASVSGDSAGYEMP